MSDAPALTDRTFDVVICGGGMAGLLMAMHLRRELPELSVAVIESMARPLPLSTHKVGESSVELGSIYMRSLGLRDYLREEHIIKLALRFFPGGGHLPIEQRDELGPARQPLMVSYQLDRGKLETDFRAMIEKAGAHLFEGVKVVDVDLTAGDAPHTVKVQRVGGEAVDGEPVEATFGARWVIDGTGRRALFRRRQGSTRRAPHIGNSGWFRVSGRLNVSDMVEPSNTEWRERPTADERWRSTIHLMGDGYWVWVIPLISGHTSVGIVAHEPFHGFDRVRTFDRCMGFLEEFEPGFARFVRQHLDGGEELLDFGTRKRYSHTVERWISPDRWAVIGEAGAFHDPLYSPGADSIGLSNSYTIEAIRADIGGGDLATRAEEMQEQIDALVARGFDFFGETGAIYRHARAMTTKYYWDNFVYWNYHCQHFAQGIFKETGESLGRFIPLRERFFAVNARAQAVLRAWVALDDHTPEGRFVSIPRFPSILIDSNLAILNEMNADDTFDYMSLRIDQAETMLGELVLRVLTELGPEKGEAFVEQTGLRGWGLDISDRRIEAEALEGTQRRRRLGKVGRDVDDHLYPPRRHPRAAEAVRLVRDVEEAA